jgi:hypothetical protein
MRRSTALHAAGVTELRPVAAAQADATSVRCGLLSHISATAYHLAEWLVKARRARELAGIGQLK